MKRYFYFYLSDLNGLPDPFANIGYVEKVTDSQLKNYFVTNDKHFNKLCELNHIKNRDLYLLTSIGMEF